MDTGYHGWGLRRLCRNWDLGCSDYWCWRKGVVLLLGQMAGWTGSGLNFVARHARLRVEKSWRAR
jgi:hypothetical protein